MHGRVVPLACEMKLDRYRSLLDWPQLPGGRGARQGKGKALSQHSHSTAQSRHSHGTVTATAQSQHRHSTVTARAGQGTVP